MVALLVGAVIAGYAAVRLLNAGTEKPLAGAGKVRGQTASLTKGIAMKNLRRLAKQLEASAHRRLRPMKRGPKIRVTSGDAQLGLGIW